MILPSALSLLVLAAGITKTVQAQGNFAPYNVTGEITVSTASLGLIGALEEDGSVQTSGGVDIGYFSVLALSAKCAGMSPPFELAHSYPYVYLGIIDNGGNSAAESGFAIGPVDSSVQGAQIWSFDCDAQRLNIVQQYNSGPYLSLCYDSVNTRLTVLQGSLCSSQTSLETAMLYFSPTNVEASTFYPQATSSSVPSYTPSASDSTAPSSTPISPGGSKDSIVAVTGDIRISIPSIPMYGYFDDSGKISPSDNFNPGMNTIYAIGGYCDNLSAGFPVQWTPSGSSLTTYVSADVYDKSSSGPVPFTQRLYDDFADIWEIDCGDGQMRINTAIAPLIACFNAVSSTVVVVQDFACHPELNTYDIILNFVPNNVPFLRSSNPPPPPSTPTSPPSYPASTVSTAYGSSSTTSGSSHRAVAGPSGFIHGSIDVNIPSLNYAGQLDTLGHFVPSAPEAFSFYALGSICRGVSSGFYIQAGESNQYGVIKMGLNNDFNSAGGAQEFYFIPSSYNHAVEIFGINCDTQLLTIPNSYTEGGALNICFDSTQNSLILLQGALCSSTTGLYPAFLRFTPTTVSPNDFYDGDNQVPTSGTFPPAIPGIETSGNSSTAQNVMGSIDVNIPALGYAGQIDTRSNFVSNAFGQLSINALNGTCRGSSNPFSMQVGDGNEYGYPTIGLNQAVTSSGMQNFYLTSQVYGYNSDVWSIDCDSQFLYINSEFTDSGYLNVCFDKSQNSITILQGAECESVPNLYTAYLRFTPAVSSTFYDSNSQVPTGGTFPSSQGSGQQSSYSYNQPAQSSYYYNQPPQSSYSYSQYSYSDYSYTYASYTPSATATTSESATSTTTSASATATPVSDFAIGTFMVTYDTDRTLRYLSINGGISPNIANAFAIATPQGSCTSSLNATGAVDLYADTGNYVSFDLSQVQKSGTYVLATPGGSSTSSNNTNIFVVDCYTRLVSVAVPSLPELVLCSKGDTMMLANGLSCNAAGGSSNPNFYFIPDLPSSF